jgi:3',5'-cyclic-AMP phosphodiesterase
MNSVRLVQFTDLHLVGNPERTLRGTNPAETLRATMTHANARFDAADAYLLTGDLVDDDPSGYAHIANAFKNSSAPVYCVPGNHDTPEQMRVALSHPPFQTGGSAVLKNWLIVLLDSFVPNTAGGRLGSDQLAELERTLKAHPKKHALICLHHHPIKMRSEWLDTVGLEDADAFQAVIARNANVRGIVWGHVHQALDLFSKGVRYMATPATCVQFKPLSDDFALDDKPPGYRVLELMADGSISTEIVWVEGNAAYARPARRQAPAA